MEQPVWRGINIQTAETLKFASTEQLLTTYTQSLRSKLSSAIVLRWLLSSYQGESRDKDGMPHGQGSAHMFGGLKYSGRFNGGLLHGQGTLEFGDGSSFTGTFAYNCIHGSGIYRWPKEAHYTGQVYQGLPHGEGSMYTGEGDCCTYQGIWKHGLRHGQGKLVYGKDKMASYEGRWVNDHKHGEGCLTYGSGSTYRGSWAEGKMCGKGRLVLFIRTKSLEQCELGRLDLGSVHIYEGDWTNNLAHGRGKSMWTWNEKETESNILLNSYVGDYVKGARQGQGVFYYASGAMYKGEWKENRKTGSGFYIYEDGTVRSGQFVNDSYNIRQDPNFVVKEPLDSLLEQEQELTMAKRNIRIVFMRHLNILRQLFANFSSSAKGVGREHQSHFFGRERGLLLEQFWRLCHEGHVNIASIP